MKVLILSCSTGEGHNSAAYALNEEFKRQNVTSFVRDALSFGNANAEKIVKDFFNNIAVKTPSLFGMMYKLGNDISNIITVKSPVYWANLLYANNMYQYILDNNFDYIVCTHLFPMEALTYLKKKYELKIPMGAILTDYTAIPFIEETELDDYFIPHKSLACEFEKKKMDINKIHSFGIPVSQKYCVKLNKNACRKELSLPLTQKIILIMTGGIGCGDVDKLLDNLVGKGLLIVVLVGKNSKLKKMIETKYLKDVLAIPFTDKVAIYMGACDVLLSKPGGLSSTEAVVLNVPLIHTKPIPGCESKNATFFSEYGLSLKIDHNSELLDKVNLLLNDADLRQNMLANQKKFINQNASFDIVKYIINKINNK